MSNSVINPFDHLPTAPDAESTSSDMESNSKILCNDNANVCPKCSSPMGAVSIATGQALYCDTCRVTNPKPK